MYTQQQKAAAKRKKDENWKWKILYMYLFSAGGIINIKLGVVFLCSFQFSVLYYFYVYMFMYVYVFEKNSLLLYCISSFLRCLLILITLIFTLDFCFRLNHWKWIYSIFLEVISKRARLSLTLRVDVDVDDDTHRFIFHIAVPRIPIGISPPVGW